MQNQGRTSGDARAYIAELNEKPVALATGFKVTEPFAELEINLQSYLHLAR